MPRTKTERLGLHLGISAIMLQQGTPTTILKQQVVALRDVAKDFLDDEDLPSFTQLVELLPDGVAEGLAEAEEFTVPDDLEGLDG